jgi:hypothetical protein
MRENRRLRKHHLRKIRELTRSLKQEEREEIKSARRRENFQKQHRKRMRKLSGLRGFVMGAVPSILGISMAGGFIFDRIFKGAADAADEAAILADRIGTTTDQAQRLVFVSDIAGTKVNEVATAMRRMGDNAQDAMRGKGMAVEALTRMGIMPRIQSGELKDQQKLLEAIIEEREKFSVFERQNLDAQIFGRGGAKIAPLLNLGIQSFREIAKEADIYGVVISENLTRSSQKFNDEIVRMKGVLAGVRNEIAEATIPAFTNVLEALREWFALNRKLIVDALMPFVRFLGNTLPALFVTVFERVDRAVNQFTDWGTVLKWLTGTMAAFGAALVTLGGLIAASAFMAALPVIITGLKAIGALLMAFTVPVLKIVAAVSVLLLVFDDFLTFLRGGESVLEGILMWFFELFLSTEKAKGAVEGLRAVWQSLFGLISQVLSNAVDGIGKFVDFALQKFAMLLEFISELAGKIGLDLDIDFGGALQGIADKIDAGTIALGGTTPAQAQQIRTNNVSNSFTVHGVSSPRESADLLIHHAKKTQRGIQ